MMKLTCATPGASASRPTDVGAVIIMIITLAVLLSLVSTAPRANAGDEQAQLRTFDDEVVDTPSPGCPAAPGKAPATVEVATFGGAGDSNRALLILEEDRASQKMVHCQAEFSPVSHVSFDWARSVPDPADDKEGFTFGLRGQAADGSEVDAWWFMIAPTGADANLRYYDGSDWSVLTVLEGWGTPQQWHNIKIAASPDQVTLWADGVPHRTSAPRNASVALGATVFTTASPLSDSSEFYVDNLLNSSSRPVEWPETDGLAFVTTAPPSGIVGEPLTDIDIATFVVAEDTDPSTLVATIDWGEGAGPESATVVPLADSEGFAVRVSHTYETADRYRVRVTISDGTDEVSVLLQIITNRPFSVITTETAPHNARFPHGIRLESGRILVAYYAGSSHQDLNGLNKVVHSDDGGTTWADSRVAVDGPHDDRDARMTQLADGTVVMVYFVTEDPAAGSAGAWIIRSTDEGMTWSEPVRIEAAGTALHAPAVELANGDLLVALYGTDPDDTSRHRSTVVRSTDGGHTWLPDSEVVIRGTSELSFLEPFLALLPDGSLIALLRTRGTEPQAAYLSRSFDDGHTWTTPQPTAIPAESHDVLITSDGMALVSYGDVGHGVFDRPLSAVLIADPYGDWSVQATQPLRLYDAGNGDQGNPASLELADGSFLTMGFHTGSRSLIGVRTELADFVGAGSPPRLVSPAELTVDVVRRAKPGADLEPVTVGYAHDLRLAGRLATATVDFGDGRGAVRAQLLHRGDGRVVITAVPYYVRQGTYQVTVVVTDDNRTATTRLRATARSH